MKKIPSSRAHDLIGPRRSYMAQEPEHPEPPPAPLAQKNCRSPQLWSHRGRGKKSEKQQAWPECSRKGRVSHSILTIDTHTLLEATPAQHTIPWQISKRPPLLEFVTRSPYLEKWCALVPVVGDARFNGLGSANAGTQPRWLRFQIQAGAVSTRGSNFPVEE